MVFTQRPLVSVIIPAYNGDRYIAQAIESILHQTYANYEIIVIDDGSTDNTRISLQSYWQQIRYIYQDNQGVSAARNRGVKESKGSLVAFLDQDDFFLPHKLALQVAGFIANPSLAIVNSGWCVVNNRGEVIANIEPWHSLPNLSLEDWLIWKPVFLGAMMFNRKCLGEIDGFDIQLHQAPDVDLVLRLVLTGCKTAWVDCSTVCYRQHDLNASRDVLAQSRELEVILDRLFSHPQLPDKIRQLEQQSRYQSLVWSAAKLYHYGYLAEMRCYLEKSLVYNPYSLTEIVLDWLSLFRNYTAEWGSELDVFVLSNSEEWQHLIASTLNSSQLFSVNSGEA
jgi:glycosyltransferase involved in cell wall biosynthesis